MTKIQVNAQGKAYIANGKALIAKEGGGAEGLWDRYLPILPDDNKPILVNIYSDEVILPAEFERLEYLQSSGTQYIDTGYVVNYTDLTLKYKYRKTSALTQNPLGVDIGTSATAREMHGNIYNTNGYYGNSMVVTSIPQQLNKDYTVIFEISQSLGYGKWTINDIDYSSASKGLNGWNGASLSDYLFKSHSSSDEEYPMTGRLYYVSYYKNNTQLERNFIPVKRKSDNVLGMYDTVTGTFKTNAGTGTFTGGAVIAPLYQSKAVEDIGYDRTQTDVFGYYNEVANIFTLVSDLTGTRINKVEYLESTGTQYIDTGYKLNSNSIFEIIAQSTDASQINNTLIGNGTNNSSSDRTQVHLGGVASAFTVRITNALSSRCFYDGTITVKIDIPNKKAYYNNTEIISDFTGSINTNITLGLCARHTANGFEYMSKARIIKLTAVESEVSIRDYIPIRVDTTAYMLDQVEWKLYPNAGTGNFIVGPDL